MPFLPWEILSQPLNFFKKKKKKRYLLTYCHPYTEWFYIIRKVEGSQETNQTQTLEKKVNLISTLSVLISFRAVNMRNLISDGKLPISCEILLRLLCLLWQECIYLHLFAFIRKRHRRKRWWRGAAFHWRTARRGLPSAQTRTNSSRLTPTSGFIWLVNRGESMLWFLGAPSDKSAVCMVSVWHQDCGGLWWRWRSGSCTKYSIIYWTMFVVKRRK